MGKETQAPNLIFPVYFKNSICPFFQGFPARILYNIPHGKAHFSHCCHSVLGKSLNVVVWEEISSLKKVLKCGHFLQGKCYNMVLCNSPCCTDWSANKGYSVLIRIHVVLLCGIGAKWVAHRNLIEGLFPRYSQMDIYLAENYMPSSGKVRCI